MRVALERSVAQPHEAAAGQTAVENGATQPTSRHLISPNPTFSESQPRTAVDKSALVLQEPKRIRDKDHLRYVASQPCLLLLDAANCDVGDFQRFATCAGGPSSV